jgi:hypothetical protein
MDTVLFFNANAIAYSATTVLPTEVCAATNTFSRFLSLITACFWKATNNSNGYSNVKFGRSSQIVQVVDDLSLPRKRDFLNF